MHFDAVEYAEQLVFMHAVKPGPANRSFGLQVAALAGLPKAVIADAKATLGDLEAHAEHHRATAPKQDSPAPQMALFSPATQSQALEALAAIDPDALSPREALEAIYRLKNLT